MKHPYLKRNLFAMLRALPGGRPKAIMRLLSLIVLFSGMQYNAWAIAVYMQDHDPWGQTQNITCMNNVFGVAGWTQYNYSTPAATIFNGSTTFVMMEGSENNDTYLEAYMLANQATIESWVNNGGRLFINAAPWNGGNENWGFGGTVLQFDNNTSLAANGTTAVPGDPIFLGPYTPTATSFSGNYFAHAWVLGTGLTTLLYDPNYGVDAHPLIAYKKWGAGVVFFGGCTQPNFWSPNTEGVNLWQNIFSYVNTISLCFNITGCPGDINVAPDANICGAVVNFTPPSGVNVCNGGAPADTFFYTGGIVNYTVPAGVTTLHMRAIGAQGGNNGGLGADMQGDFAVTPGDVLQILVGQQGLTNFTTCYVHAGAGGGGGSFIVTSSNVPLLVAGGGGGNLCDINAAIDASLSTTGNDGYSPAYPNDYGVGGVGGNGATNAPSGSGPHAGNGGGFLTDGQIAQCGGAGVSFLSGGAGGLGCGGNPDINGGFGGGAGGGNAGGGGGGGYSGGGGSYHYPGNGGGGGSYNAGSNQVNALSTGTGNGMVIIGTDNITTTLIAGLPPGSTFPIGTTTETYRITDTSGDTLYCTFNVNVVDSLMPIISCPAPITTCNNVVTGIAPTMTGTNGCSNVTYILTGATSGSGVGDASGTFFNQGVTNVKYVVTNLGGNADSCNFNVTISSPTGLLAGNTITPEAINVDVVGPADVRYTDCDLIASVDPSGGNPVNGNTNFKVTIDNATQSYNGQPYVKRHFDIEPSNNAGIATGTITLYAYQYEFDAYNLAAAGLPPLPSGGIDNGNVRISQFHGVGTAPGNYPGPEVLITPTVSWNNTYNYWEMSFPVTGFSGFYIHTAYGHPLAIGISDISAVNKGTKNRVDWKTATEDRGDMMSLERSADGAHFSTLANIATHGKASDYTYWDETPVQGVNYYRVKVTGASGDIAYTKIVTATVKGQTGQLAITAVPNPVRDKVTVSIYGSNSTSGTVEVMDPTGKRLLQYNTENNSAVIDMSGLPLGIYFIRYADEQGSVSTRINKQ